MLPIHQEKHTPPFQNECEPAFSTLLDKLAYTHSSNRNPQLTIRPPPPRPSPPWPQQQHYRPNSHRLSGSNPHSLRKRLVVVSYTFRFGRTRYDEGRRAGRALLVSLEHNLMGPAGVVPSIMARGPARAEEEKSMAQMVRRIRWSCMVEA